MPAPVVASSTPASGATGVAKNQSIRVVFSEALLASAVSIKTIYLRSLVTNDRVDTALSLSQDLLTVTLTPNALLIPNSAYEVLLVGSDISATCLKSSDNSALTLSTRINFQTGDHLNATSLDSEAKTEAEVEAEGDLLLPTDIGPRSASGISLRLLGADPGSHSFGISTLTRRLRFQFSAPVTVNTGEIGIAFFGFYDEDDFRAVKTDIGSGERQYFKYESNIFTGGDVDYLDPAFFEDPQYTITQTGNYIDINLSPKTGPQLPYNLGIEITFPSSLATTDGSELQKDLVYITYTKPYPNWASIRAVKHEIASASSLPIEDDFVGLRIWQSTMDLWLEQSQAPDLVAPARPYIEYVRYRAALDVYDDLMVLKYLNSGVVKELGDLRIQYNTAGGGAKSRKVSDLEARLKRLHAVLWGFWNSSPKTGIRSHADILEPDRLFFRDRLWKAELAQRYDEGGLTGRLAANTAYTRRSPFLGYTGLSGTAGDDA